MKRFRVDHTKVETMYRQYLPKIGIFWYDMENEELFGIDKVVAYECHFNSRGIRTTKTPHKKYWENEKLKREQCNKPLGPFKRDYATVPKGRVYQNRNKEFLILCGLWITKEIIELIQFEFDLFDVPLRVVIEENIW